MKIFKTPVLLILIMFALLSPSYAFAEGEPIIFNPSFEEGTGHIPSGWNTWQWNTSQGVTEFKTEEGEAHSGNRFVTITNYSENDARLRQTVRVTENTIYRVSCRIRTKNVGADKTGANISIEGRLETSRDLKGSITDWEETELYIRTGQGVNSFVLTLGLGGYGNTNTGTASFDDVKMERVESIPAGASSAVIEKEAANTDKETEKAGRPFWLMVVAAIAAAAAYLYYRKNKLGPNDGGGNSVKEVNGSEEKPVKPNLQVNSRSKLSKADFIIMSVMTVVYLAIALVRLGSTSVPETGWIPSFPGEGFTIEFSEEKDISRITYFCARGTGWDASGTYLMEYMGENGEYQHLATLRKDNVFIWKYANVSVKTGSIRVSVDSPGGALNEVCFFERGSNQPVRELTLCNINNDVSDSGTPENLFDEQEKYAFTPSYMNGTYFDEIYHARTAYEHIHGIEPYENTHPPLGKLFIALGILIFGMNPFGWRIIGTLFGVAMVPVMYLFGRKLFRTRFLAFCTAFLMMFDFMHFAQSRIATIDVYVTFFVIMMFYFMYDYFIQKSYETGYRESLKPLFLSGLFFALGTASKWIALYGASGLAFLFFLAKYQEYREYKSIISNSRKTKKKQWVESFVPLYINRTIAACVVFFVLLPLLIYILSYIPFMCIDGPGHGLKQVFSLQGHMFKYHSNLDQGHSFSSAWWQWPTMTKPIWFYNGTGLPEGRASSIASFGNPAVWWAGIPAFFVAIFISVKTKDRRMVVIFSAIIAQYLPWMLVPRIAFIYHYFSIVPFIILCIVYIIEYIMNKSSGARQAVYGYLALVLVLFIIFYPVLSGMEVSSDYVQKLEWFGTWIFHAG